MFSNKINIPSFILIVLNVIAQIKSLVELPIVEDNNIEFTEQVIRDTVNNLFAAFKIEKVNNSPRLKQYSTIHNFFVSITLQDCDNLKKIARLTRVNNVGNNTVDFITQINEVLNEGDKSSEANDYNNAYVGRYIKKFIKKLQHLKNKYVSDSNSVIKSDILKYLHKKGSPFMNASNHIRIRNEIPESNDNVLSDNEFWKASNRRIYNGIRTKIKKFPFMASIKFFKQFQCAGSIIKDDLVITSSSCLQLAWNNRFFRENPAFLSVQVGSDKYDVGGDTISVLEINFHPEYNPNNLNNNIAIVRLTRKIVFRRKVNRIKKIEFDRNPSRMPVNVRKVIVIGWGAKSKESIITDVFSNLLSYAELDYYPLMECKEHYSGEFVTEKHFCAGFYSEGGGACNRDAGGPGIVDGVLMGVISFGSPTCGALDSPTVFTKLGYYVDWIETIMEQPPLRHGMSTSTLPPPSTYRINFIPRTRKPIKLNPIMRGYTPAQVVVSTTTAPLRMGLSQDESFKDFLNTLFNSQEKNEFKEDIDNLKKFVDNDTDSLPKKSIESSESQLIKESTEEITTKATIYLNNDFEQSSSNNSDENESNLITKIPIRSVTVIENFSNEEQEQETQDDKSLEDGIMHLIDNLDIESIMKTEKKLLKKDGISDNDKQSSEEQFEGEQSGSTSEGTDNSIDSTQQKILDYLVPSNENVSQKENQGLSIPIEPFHDLTLREKKNTTKEALSAQSFAEMIAFAINEEEKRLKSNRYSV